ncbi:MAG: ubiquinol-cytochrome c reductase iron-sulfur subunit [Bacteroidota bacterium]
MTNKVEQKGGQQKSRRSFLSHLLSGSLVAFAVSVFYPIWRFLIPPRGAEPKPSSALAAKVDALKPNSGKIFRFGNEPGIVIKTPQGDIRAFTAVCTHLACTVQYRDDIQHIWCACHDGHYDLNGINIKGPPPRPLTPFKVNIKGDEVFASMEI